MADTPNNMSDDISGEAQPTLFALPPAQPRPAVVPQARPDTAQPTEPSEPATPRPPRPRWRTPRGRTALERLEDFLAQLRGEATGPEPPPDGVPIHPPVFQLKVTLKEIRPPIWRRVLVPANVTLARLHRIIQNTMGWEDSHLYSFTVDGRQFSEGEDPYDEGFLQATGRRLFELDLRPADRFTYVYDFGDGWQHEVRLERVLPSDLTQQYPVCLAGARACPPEDCGGPWGYGELLTILADPTDSEHESRLEWVGGQLDPEDFDLEIANLALRRAPLPELKSDRDRALGWRAMALIKPPRQRRRPGSAP